MIDITKIEYSGQYNPHLRDINNTPIITVEIITSAQAITATGISKSAFNRTINLETFDLKLHHWGYKYNKAPDSRGGGKAFYLE